MNTGSSAARKRSYFASAARSGMNKSGVTIIRLVTATKTARFSPGRDLDGAVVEEATAAAAAGLEAERDGSRGARPRVCLIFWRVLGGWGSVAGGGGL